ncbi:MAG TPA: Ig-like domain-containing protein [Longimicrobiales bacterium]
MRTDLLKLAGRAGVAAVAVLGVAAACAHVMSPPGWTGGKADRTPPQLVSTNPKQLAIVPDWKGPVVFRFDERISEQGVNDQTAIISPDTSSRVVVKRHGSEIRVQPREGWKPGRIYHVVLLPTVKDMFGNQRTAPVEVVFSTGPPIPTTAVAGLVTDRITGKPQPAALVQVVHIPDSLTYTTAADTSGFFAMRYLPEGRYLVRAFDDRNKDRTLQFKEAHAEDVADLAPGRDTSVIPGLALLPGDSTPARLTQVQERDSTTLRLVFDDYLDPARGPQSATAQLWKLPDSVLVPVSGVLYQKQLEALRPKPAPDTSAAARARAAADSAAARRAPADTARLLPVQEMFVNLPQRLAPRTRYRLTVHGITNISGIPGGGGSVTFETAAPPKVAADSTSPGKRPGAAQDGRRRGAPPDSARPAARDTTKH